MNETARAVILGLSFVFGVVIDTVVFARLGIIPGIVIAVVVVLGLGIVANETSKNPVRR